MSLNFKPIDLDMQYEYLKHFSLSPQKTSDYTFVNLLGWSEEYGLRCAWLDKLVWIQQTIPNECYWAPIGPWEAVEWNRSFSEQFSGQTPFIRIPENLLQIWNKSLGPRVIVEETRGHWDYLYAVTELMELKGKQFHKKKNLFNQFRKKYNFQYVPFDEKVIDRAMAMQEDWCTWRDCESSEALSAENRAISRILNNWKDLYGIKGGALLVGQEMVAYTIAEHLSEDTLVVHFEKANQDYKGAYQAINQMFLEHEGKEFKTVNREQDLDDEGLRKAKLSYNPIGFLKKFRVNLE